jgi:Domain of unknown function (DUF4349)
MRTRITLIVLLTAIVLSACAGGGNEAVDEQAPTDVVSEETAGGSPAAERREGEVDGDPIAVPIALDRKVITNATVELEAKDTRGAYDALITAVESSGGFVANASISDPQGKKDQPVVQATVRVPAEVLPGLLDTIERLGDRVVKLEVGTQDVTEEYVDVEARLTNLEALETELRALLAEVREDAAGKPAALLQVYDEIRRTREEIEVLAGRQRLLDDLVALATITVTVRPSPVVAPVVDEGWQPEATAREAVRNTTEAFQTIADGVIWFGLYLLPVLAAIAIPAGIVWLVVRSRRRRGAAPPAAAEC